MIVCNIITIWTDTMPDEDHWHLIHILQKRRTRSSHLCFGMQLAIGVNGPMAVKIVILCY